MKYIAKPIQSADLKANIHSGYPEPYRSQVLPREKRALGDAAGLTKIGINYTTLWPGVASSMRHWHTQEDELVYVLSGELVLVTDAGEQALKAGQCAGFPAGLQNGHQLINRGPVPAVYLEISNRDESDAATTRMSTFAGTPPARRNSTPTRTGGRTDRGPGLAAPTVWSR